MPHLTHARMRASCERGISPAGGERAIAVSDSSGKTGTSGEIIGSTRGAYGRFNVKALVIYVLGIAIQVPFMEESFFHGPWANILGGADISWMVGLVATALVYYVFASKNDLRSRRDAPAGAHASK